MIMNSVYSPSLFYWYVFNYNIYHGVKICEMHDCLYLDFNSRLYTVYCDRAMYEEKIHTRPLCIIDFLKRIDIVLSSDIKGVVNNEKDRSSNS